MVHLYAGLKMGITEHPITTRKHPNMTDTATCVPCSEGTGLLSARQIEEAQTLLPSWTFQQGKIEKRFEFKGFAKAVQMANLVAWHSDKMGHELSGKATVQLINKRHQLQPTLPV